MKNKAFRWFLIVAAVSLAAFLGRPSVDDYAEQDGISNGANRSSGLNANALQNMIDGGNRPFSLSSQDVAGGVLGTSASRSPSATSNSLSSATQESASKQAREKKVQFSAKVR